MESPLALIRKKIEKKGMLFLRISVGLVFSWFGFLKFFDNESAAENIAGRTIELMTFGYLSQTTALIVLAIVECVIGVGVLTKKYLSYVLPILYLQMAGTLMPLALFPLETWQSVFVPTLLGQYIIKNAVLIAAAIVMGVDAKGGELISDPNIANEAKEKEKIKARE